MAEGLEGLLAGRTLVKRYTIGEVIGRGGFAVVYRAEDTRLGRPVAVKVIHLHASDDAQREHLRARLQREARAAASLPHHPNVVTVHDVGTDPELGLDFLVMELLRGENLSQHLAREGRPPLPQALRVLRHAAAGLAVGHRAGLIHRDVKPGNIFLAEPHGDDGDDCRVIVLDLGIVKAMEDDQTMTRGGSGLPLSPAYAAPEQLRGATDLTPAADVFSLAVVGYELLTGERPFSAGPGQAPQGWTVRRGLRELNPQVPADVERVLMRAMSEDPSARHPDADAFADALDRATGGAGDATRIAPAAAVPVADADDRTVLAPAQPAPRPAPARAPASPPPPKRRSRWPAVLVVALLLAAAAAWAAMSMDGGDEPGTRVVAPVDGAGEPDPVVVEDGGGAADGDPGVDDTEPATAPPSASGSTAEPSAGTSPPPAGEPAAPPASGAEPPAGEPAQPQPSQPRPQQPQPSPPPQQQPRPSPPQPTQPQQPTRPKPTEPAPQEPQPTEPAPPPVAAPAPAPSPRDTIFLPPPPDAGPRG